MSGCKKSCSSNKQKTPKGTFHRTWSASTYRNQLQQQQSILNLTDYISSTLPIEARIDFYEKKYQRVMASETHLSCWIQSTRENAAPPPPIKPCKPTPTKSRLPDFLISTREKRKTRVHTGLSPFLSPSASPSPSPSSSLLPSSSPTPKSSISTFLRKASDTLTTSYNNKQPSKRLQLSPKTTPSTSQQDSSHRRFSLASSLSRLSLSRNSSSSTLHSQEPPIPTNNENKYNTTNTTKSKYKYKYKRFSTPLPPLQKCLKKTPSCSLQSSSIFLDRLGSKSPISPKSSQEPNVPSKTNACYNSSFSIGTMDQDTPPASPSSTVTDPHPQRSKRRSQQDLLFHHHATVKPSLTMMANITENKILQMNSVSTSTAALGGAVMNTTATQHQVKKKRATLLVTPSFSSIRLISQKSQFLKQSLLA